MIVLRKSVFIASIGLICSAATFAQQTPQPNNTAGDIVALCKQPASSKDQAYCNGFGQGVWDTYLVTRHPKNAPGFVCLPASGIPRDQILAQFYDWIDSNPEFKSFPAADSVLRFMATRFPCAK